MIHMGGRALFSLGWGRKFWNKCPQQLWSVDKGYYVWIRFHSKQSLQTSCECLWNIVSTSLPTPEISGYMPKGIPRSETRLVCSAYQSTYGSSLSLSLSLYCCSAYQSTYGSSLSLSLSTTTTAQPIRVLMGRLSLSLSFSLLLQRRIITT